MLLAPSDDDSTHPRCTIPARVTDLRIVAAAVVDAVHAVAETVALVARGGITTARRATRAPGALRSRRRRRWRGRLRRLRPAGTSDRAERDSVGSARRKSEKTRQLLHLSLAQTVPVERLHVRGRTGGGTDRDIGEAVPVAIGSRHGHTAGEAGECDEGSEQRSGCAAEHRHLRLPAGSGAHDDVGLAIEIDIAAGNVDAAPIAAKSEEALEQAPVAPVERLDVIRTGAGAGDDIRSAIAVHVRGSDPDAADEPGRVGVKAPHFGVRPAVEDLDVWRSSLVRAGDDIRGAIGR